MTNEKETKVVENSTEEIAQELEANDAKEVSCENAEESGTTENKTEETVVEKESESSEPEKTTQEEFISEFAPAPINIPNYDKERELRKRVKMKEKDKKYKSKKSKRRRRLVRKVISTVRSVLLFIVLFAVVSLTVTTLYVKMNTSEYAVRKAIRDNNPEMFVVGEIERPGDMHLRESSKRASIADILRDNALSLTSYTDIKGAVMRSTYPDYVAGVVHEIMHFYLFDEEYTDITKDEIKEVILENAAHITAATGIEHVGETMSDEIAGYIVGSEEISSLSFDNIVKQKAAKHTDITSVLFSTMSLLCFVIALLLFIVITILLCKEYAYKLIGWASILSGALFTIIGFLYKPAFAPNGEFVRSVFEVITKSLNQSALVFGGVTILVGALVMLIGSSMNDDDEYEEDNDEYIEEAEDAEEA